MRGVHGAVRHLAPHGQRGGDSPFCFCAYTILYYCKLVAEAPPLPTLSLLLVAALNHYDR
jgi:hypothetical protein